MMDLPRKTLMRRADEALMMFGDLAEVHFKFTCEKCGERCTLDDPNILHKSGECHKCGHKTEIKKGGFMLQMIIGGE